MDKYKTITYDNYLIHHGILGQKWGVRRYQNKDGSFTEEGKKKYRVSSVKGNIGRAITNTTIGQRIHGVGFNRGYAEDVKKIRSLYKTKKKEFQNIEDTDKRKEKIKSLKSDYKKTLGEARTTAAQILYPWQSKSTNEKIQTQNIGKAATKFMLLGGYGSLNYDRLSANDVGRGKSFVVGFATGTANYYAKNLIQVGDYMYNRARYKYK